MKPRTFYLIFFISIYLIASCSNSEKSKLEIRDFNSKGITNSNHLEEGGWQFYGLEKQDLCQEGIFLNGIRHGIWHYYKPFKDSIFWLPYYNIDSVIKTNIPDFLTIEEDEGSFIAFKHKDSSKLMKLKIAIAKSVDFNLNAYNKSMLEEVYNKSLKVKSHDYSQINTTCGRAYNFNRFFGVDKDNRSYILLSINGILKNGILAEITVRCDADYMNIGEEMFYSVMNNFFVKGDRFFDSYIDCEILLDRHTKSSWSFSFGCNKRKSD